MDKKETREKGRSLVDDLQKAGMKRIEISDKLGCNRGYLNSKYSGFSTFTGKDILTMEKILNGKSKN